MMQSLRNARMEMQLPVILQMSVAKNTRARLSLPHGKIIGATLLEENLKQKDAISRREEHSVRSHKV